MSAGNRGPASSSRRKRARDEEDDDMLSSSPGECAQIVSLKKCLTRESLALVSPASTNERE